MDVSIKQKLTSSLDLKNFGSERKIPSKLIKGKKSHKNDRK
jgi:hypothetical protein